MIVHSFVSASIYSTYVLIPFATAKEERAYLESKEITRKLIIKYLTIHILQQLQKSLGIYRGRARKMLEVRVEHNGVFGGDSNPAKSVLVSI